MSTVLEIAIHELKQLETHTRTIAVPVDATVLMPSPHGFLEVVAEGNSVFIPGQGPLKEREETLALSTLLLDEQNVDEYCNFRDSDSIIGMIKCGLNALDIEDLFKILARYPEITTLRLRNISLSPQALTALEHALLNNTTIHKIELGVNVIPGEKIVTVLAKVMVQRPQPLSVNFTNKDAENCYTQKSKQILQYAREGKKDKLDQALAVFGKNLFLPSFLAYKNSFIPQPLETKASYSFSTSKKLTCFKRN